MNLEFLVVALLVSKLVDWIFQTQWQAENKTRKWDALYTHSLMYSGLTSLFLTVIIRASYAYVSVFMILFLSHIVIDDRWIVKRIMMFKGMTKHQVYSKEYGWLELGIDQRLHELVILGMALVI